MILVTGATSAVGKAVIKELLARKVSVRAFVRKPVDVAKLHAQGVVACVGDEASKRCAGAARYRERVSHYASRRASLRNRGAMGAGR